MIDRLSLPVTDLDRSAAFYDDALKPLGFTRVMEVDEPEAGYRAVAYGPSPDRPVFWVGTATMGRRRRRSSPASTLPSWRRGGPPSTPFTQPRSRRAAGTTARRACDPNITRTITAGSSWTPTAIT